MAPLLQDAPERAAVRPDPSVKTPEATADEAVEAAVELGMDGEAWRFIRWTIGVTVVVLAAIAGFNAWVDSTGTLGTGLVDPMAELPRDRRAKAALIERADDPGLVVLGSSRSKRIDPTKLDPAAVDGVNAAAVASDMLEQRVVGRWLAERAERGRPFPHLVIGVDVEQWRHSSLRSSGLLAVPQLADLARREARDRDSLLELAPQLDDLLLTWSATRTSIESLRSRDAAERKADDAAQAEDASTLTREVDEFDARGILHSDRRLTTPRGRAYLQRELPTELRATIASYERRYAEAGPDVDANAEHDFLELVDIATSRGDVPTVYLTPMHPAMARALDPHGRRERHAHVRELLHDLAAQGRIRFTDCTNCLSSDPRFWVDGVHLSPVGATRLASVVRRRLAPAARE